tara:strand:+ start:3154 stop:3318 length:165 start_codon:yes stop_codon:yes gene_type:complete
MKNKERNPQKERIGVTREKQKKEGYFDGRFVEKSEKSKKAYNRKSKYKDKEWDF